MAVLQEETINKGDIRTMKKDLKKLREADTVFESEKIIKSKGVKNSEAKEAEKQRLFLFNAKAKEVKDRIKTTQNEKTKATIEKSAIEKKQEKLKEDIKIVAEHEKLPYKKWEKEKELAALERQKVNIHEIYENIEAQETKLTKKADETGEAIKKLHSEIEKNPANATEQPAKPPTAEAIPKTEIQPSVMPEAKTPGKPVIPMPHPKIHEDIARKLSETSKTEEIQRRKFMEDVERWANDNKV